MDNEAKIFVSYTTKDSYIDVDYLKCVHEKCIALGSVYIDLLHNDSLNKQDRVCDELLSSNFLILINSDSVNKSHWVKWEISTANKIGIPIIRLNPKFSISDLEKKLLGVITRARW